MRRLSEDGTEGPNEVRRGDVGDGGDGAHVEGLGVRAVHRVAGAEHAPVQMLDRPAHGRKAALRRGGWCVMPASWPTGWLVGDTGLEPVTSCMSSKCSNQLS